MKKLLLTFLFPLTMLAQSPTLENFNASHFIVDWTAAVTNVIKLRNNPTNYWLLSGVGVEPIPGIVLVTADNFLAHTSIWDEGELHTFGNKSFTLTNGVNDLDLTGYAFFYMQGTNTNCVVNLSFQGVGAHVWLVNGSNSTFTIPTAPHHDYPSFNQQFRGGYWQPSEVGEAIHLLGTTNGMVELGRSSPNSLNLAIINPTDGYVPYRSNSTQFADSPFYMSGTNIATDSQIIFGPGTTNVLYRSGTDLVVTNGAVDAKISVLNGSANGVSLEAQGTAGVVSVAGSSTSILLRSGSDQLNMYSGSWYPVTDLSLNNGTMAYSWKDSVASNVVVRGFYGGIPDYSKLVISQQGSNQPVVFDQITAGTAGYSRGFSFRTNGVEIASFTGTGGGGTYVARAGDTMTGVLTLPNAIFTNNATTTVPLQINATNGTTANLIDSTAGGTNIFSVSNLGLIKAGGLESSPPWSLGAYSTTKAAPVFRASTTNHTTALDILPNGTPLAAEQGTDGLAWIDVCDTDFFYTYPASPLAVTTARLGVGTNFVEVGSRTYGAGTVKPVLLTVNGTPRLRAETTGRISISTTNFVDGGQLDILKDSTYSTEYAGITIQCGDNSKPELLLGVDSTKTIAYVQSAQRSSSFTAVPLVLNPNGGAVAIGSNAGTPDLFLNRDGAANTLALRNGTSAQKYNVYNTWSNSGTDYERGVLDWQTTANSFRVGTEMGGTGTSRSLQFCQGGTNIFYLDGATGHVLFNTDGTKNIGSYNANRPASIYTSSTLHVANGVFAADGTTDMRFIGSDGVSFGKLILGTATTAYPAIKRNAAGIDIRLADDSNYSFISTDGIKGGRTKVLTSTTAADFLYVSVGNTNGIGGHVVYTVFATDGTDVQELSGDVKFAAVAKGTTVTATLADVQGPAAVTGGSTLTAAIASNVTTNNIWALGVTATTSLTTTNLLIKWRLETPSTYTVNAIP